MIASTMLVYDSYLIKLGLEPTAKPCPELLGTVSLSFRLDYCSWPPHTFEYYLCNRGLLSIISG